MISCVQSSVDGAAFPQTRHFTGCMSRWLSAKHQAEPLFYGGMAGAAEAGLATAAAVADLETAAEGAIAAAAEAVAAAVRVVETLWALSACRVCLQGNAHLCFGCQVPYPLRTTKENGFHSHIEFPAGPAFTEPQDRESRIQAQRDSLRLMPTQEESQAATQRMTEALPQHALVRRWLHVQCIYMLISRTNKSFSRAAHVSGHLHTPSTEVMLCHRLLTACMG